VTPRFEVPRERLSHILLSFWELCLHSCWLTPINDSILLPKTWSFAFYNLYSQNWEDGTFSVEFVKFTIFAGCYFILHSTCVYRPDSSSEQNMERRSVSKLTCGVNYDNNQDPSSYLTYYLYHLHRPKSKNFKLYRPISFVVFQQPINNRKKAWFFYVRLIPVLQVFVCV
jgi:hypothetical protein